MIILILKSKVKSIITINTRKLTSWSEDPNIAFPFGNLSSNSDIETDYGIILKTVIKDKNKVLVDINKTIPNSDFDVLKEVILLPGTYKCEIVSIHNKKTNYNKDLSFGLYKMVSI